jgi:hypothetical protein
MGVTASKEQLLGPLLIFFALWPTTFKKHLG